MGTRNSTGRFHLEISLQLIIGALLVFAGGASALHLSNVWTATDVKYAEYVVLVVLGGLLMAGALRRD